MENVTLYSLFLLVGGFCGFFINSWFTWRSQKISQENFYAEHFLKVKAERLIKTLELLSFLKFHLINPEQVTLEETNSLIVELRKVILSLHCFIDQNNYNKLAEFYANLAKASDNKKQENIEILNDSFETCFYVLSKYLPKDYLFKKRNI